MPVEALEREDRCLILDGVAPIVWVGRRKIDCTKQALPHEVWPVWIRAGAFGDGLPQRICIYLLTMPCSPGAC